MTVTLPETGPLPVIVPDIERARNTPSPWRHTPRPTTLPPCPSDHDHRHHPLRHRGGPSWDRVHPRLTHRGCWIDHEGELPVIEGTLIRLQVEHLPGDRNPKPVWLWTSITGATAADVDRWWQAYLRRFDLEHTFRLFKQSLGWTTPKLRDPEAADRWTWLLLAAHTQLRLARPLVADLRRPWEKPAPPGRLTPARVRRGFRNIRPTTLLPARAPKPSRPGPGRPPGSRNRHPAHQPRRRQNGQTRPDHHRTTRACRLKIKLSRPGSRGGADDGRDRVGVRHVDRVAARCLRDGGTRALGPSRAGPAAESSGRRSRRGTSSAGPARSARTPCRRGRPHPRAPASRP